MFFFFFLIAAHMQDKQLLGKGEQKTMAVGLQKRRRATQQRLQQKQKQKQKQRVAPT